ncbi:uncharacterized protein LOC100210662 isoform X5 [Hydra vulgaris]|uniref:Metalloendopeptidase n=1 Tax=Hydra vulgaris TaxID=6087 RepID=A0ABM4BXU0_HYDVU
MFWYVLLVIYVTKSIQRQINQIKSTEKPNTLKNDVKKNDWLNFETADEYFNYKRELWTNGVIPFTVEYHKTIEDLTKTQALTNLNHAILGWETKTCIRFVSRHNETDYVIFYFSGGQVCRSDSVGRGGGMQIIYLGNGCLDQSVISHEIGHVVGFLHEHNRPDRDDFVTIATENINLEKVDLFKKFPFDNVYYLGLEYDYFSIMHYPMKAFSINQKETIIPKQSHIKVLGNDKLSKLDIKKVNFLYKCDVLNSHFDDEVWSVWSRWKPCTESCGGGTRERTRVCRIKQNSTKRCLGNEIETEVCNIKECPDWPHYPKDFSFANERQFDETLDCVLIYESEDFNEWSSYSFCQKSKRKIGMKWSDKGPINKMKCTLITEPLEERKKSWFDNYLCLPISSPFNFTWSYEGPIENLSCIMWYAKNGKDGWDNNFLCAKESVRNYSINYSQSPNYNQYESWSEWSKCTKECGTGKQSRLRLCYSKQRCHGKRFEETECNVHKCPDLCFKEFTANKGQFHSINYPNMYPSNLNCSWLLRGGKNQQVKLTIENLDFERFLMEDCIFDYLVVRDSGKFGKELGRFCGKNTSITIISHASSLWLNMITDYQENRHGFNATWELIDRIASNTACFTIKKGELSTPNFPSLYWSNMNCEWEIVTEENSIIVMRFIWFETEIHESCKYDYLQIIDGSGTFIKDRICGINPFKEILVSKTNKVKLKFISNEAIEKRGFKLKWKSYKKML